MPWWRRSAACARSWGNSMGLFSFLTRDKSDTAVADSPSTTSAGTPPDASTGEAIEAPIDLDTGALTAPMLAPAGDGPQVGPLDPVKTAELQGPVIEVIKTVFDPEIPVDIYELGLIYEIIADADGRVLVKMTLTSPACPSAQQIPSEVRYKVKTVPGVTEAWVEIVWEPPWTKELMSEAAKLQLGFF
jgi:FeS assembly SUF system protein